MTSNGELPSTPLGGALDRPCSSDFNLQQQQQQHRQQQYTQSGPQPDFHELSRPQTKPSPRRDTRRRIAVCPSSSWYLKCTYQPTVPTSCQKVAEPACAVRPAKIGKLTLTALCCGCSQVAACSRAPPCVRCESTQPLTARHSHPAPLTCHLLLPLLHPPSDHQTDPL